MQAVITAEQARKITGGRTPLVPVEYETACRALAECSTLDEAKYWDNKADALAAWARIYKNDQAGVEARRLKLHAHRRMSQLANELRPSSFGTSKGSRKGMLGSPPGARSLLIEKGVPKNQAATILRVGKVAQDEFDRAVNSPRPPAPCQLLKTLRDCSPAWIDFTGTQGPSNFRGFCRRNDAKALAAGLAPDEAMRARGMVTEIIEWLDEFEQHLTK